MIDKEAYRKNFQGGGADMGAPDKAQDRADKGYGNTSGPQDKGSPEQNRNQRDIVANQGPDYEKIDYVGDTIFGPTQKYSGDGFFSGYRNLDAQGQPLMGLAYVGDRLQSMLTPSNILGGILGLINPLAGLAFRGANYLRQEVPETIDQFRDSETLEEFRDKVRGYGTTIPVIPTTPAFGGIESLGVQGVQPVKNIKVNQPYKIEELL